MEIYQPKIRSHLFAPNKDTVEHAWCVDMYLIFPNLKHSSQIISIWDVKYAHDVKAHMSEIREAGMAEKIERDVQ